MDIRYIRTQIWLQISAYGWIFLDMDKDICIGMWFLIIYFEVKNFFQIYERKMMSAVH